MCGNINGSVPCVMGIFLLYMDIQKIIKGYNEEKKILTEKFVDLPGGAVVSRSSIEKRLKDIDDQIIQIVKNSN